MYLQVRLRLEPPEAAKWALTGTGLGLAFPSAFIRRNNVQNWINFSIEHAAWTWGNESGNAACGMRKSQPAGTTQASSCTPVQASLVQARPGQSRGHSRIVNCTCRLLLRSTACGGGGVMQHRLSQRAEHTQLAQSRRVESPWTGATLASIFGGSWSPLPASVGSD